MATSQTPRTEGTYLLAPPSGSREVLKTNVYELMRQTATQLVPLFPYVGRGAMLPAGALFRGAPGADYGRFFHRNSEEEVAVCFGANGALGAAGLMFILGKMHEVQSPLLDPNDPESFLVSVITQRQPDGGDQRETVTFRCKECNNRLYHFEYPASMPEDSERNPQEYGGREDDAYDMFATMWGGVVAADEFNGDEKVRTCDKCGHVNQPFPIDRWGWDRWVSRHEVVNAARHRMIESASGVESEASS